MEYNPMWYSFPPDPTGKITMSPASPPTASLPIIDVRDYGKFVLVAIENPEYAKGGEIIAATDWVTMGDIAQDIGRSVWRHLIAAHPVL